MEQLTKLECLSRNSVLIQKVWANGFWSGLLEFPSYEPGWLPGF